MHIMEALDFAAFGSFVVLAALWVVLPLRAPAAPAVIATASTLEAAAA
jgi:hypothetical protein